MDELDIKLITLLQEDGRISISKLSERMALSRPSVAERVKRLEEKGMIEGYTALISPEAIGRKLLVIIELSDILEPLNKIEEKLASEPAVIECHRATGHVHYYIKAALYDIGELTRLVESLLPYGKTKTSVLLGTPVKKG
ncbi:Lrp/AsnC family transcriptional regulator [Oceanobacillus sp. AG]|uniref:Lrp/AsnC family transcriptional regulator n=1 Tax=Oceanobacillus sp. AG TaxID=2681969 RepID=UPI0012EC194F|nr:Lrp/AsnC family transcriptional regulator [Oceanobacillus sp. AG]